jgi:hypothetical protein
MSDTPATPSGPASGPPSPEHPADCLINLIVILLTPMFLGVAGGDLAFARLAAIGTLDSYRAQTHADHITVAKIIAFGLAALDSICRSMEEDLTVSQILRLRGSANALDRAEHRNRLALRRSQAAAAPPIPDPQPRPIPKSNREPAPAATAPAPTAPAPTGADQQYAEVWAASAARIAAETTASLPSLSPEERHSAEVWVDALNGAATDFRTAGTPPRPSPGNLATLFQATGP